MTIALGLIAYGLLMSTFGSRALARLTAQGHAPRFAVAAWCSAIGSTLFAVAAAAVLGVVELVEHMGDSDELLASCLLRLGDMLAGRIGSAAQIISLTTLTLLALATAVTATRLVTSLRHIRFRTHEHADAVRIVGKRKEGNVVIIEADEPAAYCVAGRPPAIVLTTGALSTLSAAQLAAVLAHERAHLSGRHPLILATLRSLTTSLPRTPLTTAACGHVATLLEMCADDAAARSYGREPLLSGLLTLTGAVSPAGALSAAGVAVLARVSRLKAPPAQAIKTRSKAILGATVMMLTLGPLLAATLAALGYVCGP